MTINVLSLFDGKSSGYTAIELAGYEVGEYYSAEIDKYAITVSDAIHPRQHRLGSVTNWAWWGVMGLDWASIDVVLAGFPCQAWSVAGKQQGDRDERGALFWVMLDILKEARKHNPSVRFLIENVKMKKEFEEYITHHTENALGEVYKILINSALVSAQNRNRYYWTSFPVSQPKDKKIVLADILENGVVDNDKSYCIDANYFKGGNLKSYFEKHRRQLVFNQPCRVSERGRRLTVCGTRRDDKLGEIVRGYEGGDKNKTTCLTTVQKDNYILQDYTVRKLTPRECFRLQAVPEKLIDRILDCGVSNTQLYKIAGNGWTDEVISHILKGMPL